jgi:hypothetical protein
MQNQRKTLQKWFCIINISFQYYFKRTTIELTGKIKVLKEPQNIGSSSFSKREVVITTEHQYPQDIL